MQAMSIVEDFGTGFAFPSQTLYLGADDVRPIGDALPIGQRSAA